MVRNYPNPFNSSTTITFDVRETADVSIAVFNAIGQRVMNANLPRLGASTHSYPWDASNASTGMYFCVVNAGGVLAGRKLLLMR